MDVRFLKGTWAEYMASTKVDDTTFAYITEGEHAGELWFGKHNTGKLLSNEVTLAQFNALEARVKTLEDADFQAQIDAIKETLKSIATSDTVVAIDNRLKTVEEDYLKSADKEALQAEIDADVKVVSDYIANNEAKWSEKYDDTALAARVTAVEEVADAAQTAQEVSDAIDAKIADLNLANTYEAKGAAATAEQNAKDYADQALVDFENAWIKADENGTVDKLNEIAAWLNTEGAGAQKIIADVAANTANIATNAGDIDKVEAKLSDVAEGKTVKALIDEALQAAKDYADENDANTVYDDTALAGRVSTLEGKVDVVKVSEAIATAKSEAISEAASDAANKYVAKEGYVEFTQNEKNKLAGLENYNDTEVRGLIEAAKKAGDDAQADVDALELVINNETTGLTAAHTKAQAGVDAAAAADAKAVAAQGEVDALEEVVAANAKTCSDNFTTISNQLTWGSF